MKKLIILFAILLIGASSISAQGQPYQVTVSWSYAYPYYCVSELTSDYVFLVTLNIYDVANGVEVTDGTPYHVVSWSGITTTFDEDETNVEGWCNEAPKTPVFRVSATVRMVNTNTQNIFCVETFSDNTTCYDFSITAYVCPIIFH